MKWVIQEKVFGEETDLLIAALQRNKIEFFLEKADEGILLKENFMLRGSIDFVEFYQELNDRCLGFTLENYDCSHYYTWFKDYLLNRKCLFMSWAQLSDNEDLIFNAWPGSSKFFIRPNSGRKLFTGTTLTKKWWYRELKIISELPSTNGLKSSDLVLVAPAQEILAEYRCVMHYGNLIDYSQYAGNPQPDEHLNIKLFTDLPQSFNWYPDQLYTMDIAATTEGWKILELNSFVSAGLYNIDYDKLVNYIEENIK